MNSSNVFGYLQFGESSLPITKRALKIGSNRKDNNLWISNDSIGAEHAVIIFFGNKLVLYDLGSTYGTYVNGSKYKRKILDDNDKIRLGNVECIFKSNLKSIIIEEKDEEEESEVDKYYGEDIPSIVDQYYTISNKNEVIDYEKIFKKKLKILR